MKTNFKPVNVLTMDPETDVLIEEETVTKSESNLIIWNDDVNTFDFVIKTLIDVCDHEFLQAVQCANLIHNTGRCSVKRGSYKKLEPLCYALLDRKISATIE